MKHLLKFNESKVDIINDINGIFIELKDIGFLVESNLVEYTLTIKIQLVKKNSYQVFNYVVISDQLLMLNDYIKYKWVDIDIIYEYFNHHPSELDSNTYRSKTPPDINKKLSCIKILIQKIKE